MMEHWNQSQTTCILISAVTLTLCLVWEVTFFSLNLGVVNFKLDTRIFEGPSSSKVFH